MSGATDRALVYRMLAKLFQPPEPFRLDTLRDQDLPAVRMALARLKAPGETTALCNHLGLALERSNLTKLGVAYEAAFEPSSGAERPPNETAYAPKTPQEGLTRTFELADIAGFYRAFGVEVTPGTERVDHIVAELEFMHLLAVKEAAAEQRGEDDRVSLCRDAAAAFLGDHLARWCPTFRDHLAKGSDRVYEIAGKLLAGFVEHDVGYLGAGAGTR